MSLTSAPRAVLPRDLPSLTALRAFAALAVFAFHLNTWHIVRLPPAALGYIGVAFFFVLSGFVLSWSYGERPDTTRFLVRRFARVYPAFFAMWVAALLVPVTGFVIRPVTAVLNLFLLQAWVPVKSYTYSLNGVSWSLSCEAFFYLLFPLAVGWLARRRLRTAVVATGLAFALAASITLVASLVQNETLGMVAFADPLVRFPEFLLGVVTARAVRAGWRPTPGFAAGVVVVCAAGMVLDHSKPAPNTWVTPVIAIMIAALSIRDSTGRSWLWSAPAQYAGRVSYCFYLVHELCLLNLLDVLGPGPGTAVVALATCVVASVALHHVVEKPAHNWIVKRFAARRPVSVAATAAVGPG